MNKEGIERLRKLGKQKPLTFDIPETVGAFLGALIGYSIIVGVPVLVGLAAWKYVVS